MVTRYQRETEPATFELIPAMDLLGGRVVRLRQGDFARSIAYSDDPIATATAFAEQGARWLHIVDLDGARAGEPVQTRLVEAIVGSVRDSVSCQVAGGLRTKEAIDRARATGAARLVLGTAALTDRELVGRAVADHGGFAIAVAIDVRRGLAVGDAWRKGADGASPERAIEELSAIGVEGFVVTAIDRDGLLAGPDLELLGRLVAIGRGAIVASGGISSIGDLRAVRAIGCAGAILGRALYEDRLDLREAIEQMSRREEGGRA